MIAPCEPIAATCLPLDPRLLTIKPPHPTRAIKLLRPGQQLPRIDPLRQIPLRAVALFFEPQTNLFLRPLMMHFRDHDRTLRREQPSPAAQHLALTALHIDLDYV